MPERVKSLELNGYKSFAAKSFFEFSENITVIVGPNGSGKSNIADSIRWVLGEQSYRLLRGRRTDDMIFSGSEKKSRSGMASATVTFDNSDGWLPIDFSEVSISRRAYRDGQNEYLVNNQKVRLRDVTEMLANSGLSERTYTVIGQGLVDTTLSLKAEERRRLFEEAAGIGLYRYRKDQSIKRLDKTKRNLERVQDILAELGPRLRSLQRQSKRAIEYEQVRADLRETLREWYGYHWHRAQKELHEARETFSGQEDNLHAARKDQDKIDETVDTLRNQVTGLRGRLNSWHRQLSQVHSQREEISRKLAVNRERRRGFLEEKNRLEGELARLEEDRLTLKSRVDEFASKVDLIKGEIASSQKEMNLARNALEEIKSAREENEHKLQEMETEVDDFKTRKVELNARAVEYQDRIDRLGAEINQSQENLNLLEQALEKADKNLEDADKAYQTTEKELEERQNKYKGQEIKLSRLSESRADVIGRNAEASSKLAGLKAEYEVLIQAEENLTGYSTGAKILLQAMKDGHLKGDNKAFGVQLDVDPKYEIAVAAALGDYVDAILIDSKDGIDTALELFEGQTARAALLPLDALAPLSPISIKDKNGILGIVSDFVKCDAKLRPAVDLILGQVILVEDRDSARKFLSGKENHLKAVTINGEIFHASGEVLFDSGSRSITLSRPRERKSLEEKISKIEKEIETLNGEIQGFDDVEKKLRESLYSLSSLIEEAQEEFEKAISHFNLSTIEKEKAQNKFLWQQDQQENFSIQKQEVQSLLEDLVGEIREIESRINHAEENLKKHSISLKEISTEEQLAQVSFWETQLAVGKQSLEDAINILEERTSEYDQFALRLDNERGKLGSVEENLQKLDIEINDLRSKEEEVNHQIEELQGLIGPSEKELREVEEERSSLLNNETKIRQTLSIAERHYTQAQAALTRKQEALDLLREKIEDDFGLVEFEYQNEVSGPTPLPFFEMVERMPVQPTINPDLEETLKRQRMQLRRMGAVNPEAQKEYLDVKERHEFLTNQMEDLQEAETDIRSAIKELDILMEREFRKTFEVVATEFKKLFTRLFGGGSARLVLLDSEDINEVGIDIEARLPGKREQQLSMLSGGERSLTATALIFSLIKASPTPFCVLDEVDAALDEANVGRFRDVLSELSKETQFVVITHNRHTVQAADVIYGITMGRDTTSQSISLKLEDVDERYSSS